MTGPGEFASHRRDGDDVVKVLDARHPAGARLAGAALRAGQAGMLGYLSALRAAGIRLPPGLTVLPAGPLAVRHRWVAGPGLPACAAADPPLFASAVTEIAGWVQALAPADARMDASLANFCLPGGQVVLIDVLPPLIPSLRPEPQDLFEVLFSALCFDTPVIHDALIGYAAQALLRHSATGCRQAGLTSKALPAAGALAAGFPASWFRARAVLGLLALDGRVPARAADEFFALTSVRAFRELPEGRRAHRIRCAGQAMRDLAVT